MKTYYAAFGHRCGYDALLKICDTMEEAKAAIYEAAAEKRKSNNEYDPDYDTYYITAETV